MMHVDYGDACWLRWCWWWRWRNLTMLTIFITLYRKLYLHSYIKIQKNKTMYRCCTPVLHKRPDLTRQLSGLKGVTFFLSQTNMTKTYHSNISNIKKAYEIKKSLPFFFLSFSDWSNKLFFTSGLTTFQTFEPTSIRIDHIFGVYAFERPKCEVIKQNESEVGSDKLLVWD